MSLIINLKFPPFFQHTCSLCGTNIIQPKFTFSLCLTCYEKLPFNGNYCQYCGISLADSSAKNINDICGKCQAESYFLVDKWHLPFTYKNDIRNLVTQMKFHKKADVAQLLGNLLSSQLVQFDENFVIIPVPSDAFRLAIRGFNQTQIMAQAVSKQQGLKLIQCIKKKSFTIAQSSLDKKSRENNLDGVFTLFARPPNKVILLDDVTTTGTTIRKIAHLLKTNGCQRVEALVLASA